MPLVGIRILIVLSIKTPDSGKLSTAYQFDEDMLIIALYYLASGAIPPAAWYNLAQPIGGTRRYE